MDFLTDKFLVDRNNFSGPVLVTGAGGCIGAWVVAILARSGVNVIASDLSSNKSRAGLILGDAVNELVWEQCDVTDFSALKAFAKKTQRFRYYSSCWASSAILRCKPSSRG
jgi:NAD(P)-dependent dehydrogenase (short-subunit alcohol dehydrogenase family)